MRRSLAIAAALIATAAFAYVLPAYSILRRMTDARDDLQVFTWRIDGSLSAYGETAKQLAAGLRTTVEGNELQVDGTASLKIPGRCRFEGISLDGASVAAISNGGKSRTEGTAVPALQLANDEVCAILANRSNQEGEARANVERHLSKLGVDQRKTSLGRFGGTVAYVLGDPADGKPQFWVFKDAFTPARVRFNDAQGQAWDVRFLDYTSPATGEAYPRVVEVWKGTELQLRFTVLKAEPKAQLADKLF